MAIVVSEMGDYESLTLSDIYILVLIYLHKCVLLWNLKVKTCVEHRFDLFYAV